MSKQSGRISSMVRAYWFKNLLIMGVLLLIWAIIGPGCGILFADALNQYEFLGFPLGFWFAQQGSILVFVVLILLYAVLLNRLDRSHRRELSDLEAERDAA